MEQIAVEDSCKVEGGESKDREGGEAEGVKEGSEHLEEVGVEGGVLLEDRQVVQKADDCLRSQLSQPTALHETAVKSDDMMYVRPCTQDYDQGEYHQSESTPY